MNREIFFLIWDSGGLHNAAKSAFNAGVCLAQTQLWTNQRNGRKKAPYFSKMLRQKSRLLSAAFNSYTKTHPIMQFFARKVGHPLERCYLHAEIHAILKCKAKRIYRITVERYDSFGFPANSKPCAICAAAIKAYGIQVVEHT